MSNKLSLLVNFIGVDKMSGALRNIVGLGRNGSQSLRALNGEARRLQREMKDVGRELKGASGNVTQLIDRERALERALAGVNRQMDRQRKLAAINADTKAIQARGTDLKNRGVSNITGGAGLAAPIILAVKAAGDFSSGMVDIQQKADLSDRATERLGNRIVRLAEVARQLPEDMRAGFDVLLAAGLGVDPATKMIGPIGRLATAYKVEIPDAAHAGFAAITNLKIAADDTARVFDIMASAGNSGSFEIADMARQFPGLTAQMQALGQVGVPAVADLAAALQVAMHAAGNADEAGNNIENLLAKINAPGTITAFKKNFGVDLPAAMKKLEQQGYSSLEAIALITKKATKGDMKKLGFAFEDQQARSGILALIQNLDEYRRIRASALQAGGTVDRQFNQRVARDATVQWRAFMGTASSLAITLGTTLLPVITDVLGTIQSVAMAASRWAQQNPQLAGALMKVASALIIAKIGLGVLQFAFGGILGPIASTIGFFRKLQAIGAFGTVFTRLAGIVTSGGGALVRIFGVMRVAALFLARGVMQAGLLMLTNPIVLAITLIVLALAAAGYLIYANWDKIKAAFAAGITWIKGALAAVPAWLSNIGSMMMQGLLLALNPVLLVNRLLSVARAGVTAFKNFFGIKSPSRLMMEMGGHVTGGLAMGIDRGGGRAQGSMDRVMGGLAQSASRPIGGGGIAGRLANGPTLGGGGTGSGGRGAGQAGGSGGAGAAPITITVYGAQGQDVRQLAREVKREIDKATGVTARSSYEGDR